MTWARRPNPWSFRLLVVHQLAVAAAAMALLVLAMSANRLQADLRLSDRSES